MSGRPVAPGRGAFRLWRPIQTRWADNDIYGHVNNVQYYAYFDTLVNGAMMEAGLLDPLGGESIGLVVGSSCDYFASLAFPDRIEGGLAVARLGTSAITWRLGIFAEGHGTAAAAGHFTHVHVGRDSRRPVPLPEALRAWAGGLLAEG